MRESQVASVLISVVIHFRTEFAIDDWRIDEMCDPFVLLKVHPVVVRFATVIHVAHESGTT